MVRILNGFDGYMTLDASQNSDLISIGHAKNFAIQTVVTGAPTGTLFVQVSCDQNNWLDWSWTDKDGYTQRDGYSMTGSEYVDIMNFSDVGAGWARVRYAFGSGTGGLTFTINAKK